MVCLCIKYFLLLKCVYGACSGGAKGCKEFDSVHKAVRKVIPRQTLNRNHTHNTERETNATVVHAITPYPADRNHGDHLALLSTSRLAADSAPPSRHKHKRNAFALPLSCILFVILLAILLKVAFVSCCHIRIFNTSNIAGDYSMLRVVPLAACWTLVGAVLVILDKYIIMSEEDGGFGFPYPLSLGVAQMFGNMILTRALSIAKPHMLPSVAAGDLSWGAYARNVVPVGFTLVLSLLLSNAAYLHHSYIQVLKAAGPVSVYIFSCMAGIDIMRLQFFLALGAVTLGVTSTWMGKYPLSSFGFMLQIGAFVCHGIKLVLQKLMVSSHGCKLDPLSALYYFSPVCFLGLTMLAAFVEPLDDVLQNANEILAVLVLNVLVAFALQVVSMFLLWYVSATTYSLCSVVGDVGLVCSVSIYSGTPLTNIQVIGYASAVCGVLLFTALQEDRRCINRAFGYCEHQETKGLSAA